MKNINIQNEDSNLQFSDSTNGSGNVGRGVEILFVGYMGKVMVVAVVVIESQGRQSNGIWLVMNHNAAMLN